MRSFSLAVELKKAFGLDSELISGNRGDFEIKLDADKIFLKQNLSLFPEPGEISRIIN